MQIAKNTKTDKWGTRHLTDRNAVFISQSYLEIHSADENGICLSWISRLGIDTKCPSVITLQFSYKFVFNITLLISYTNSADEHIYYFLQLFKHIAGVKLSFEANLIKKTFLSA